MIFGVVIGAIIAAAVAVPAVWFGLRALRRTPGAAVPGAAAGLVAGLTLGPAAGAVIALGATAAARTAILLWRREREAARAERAREAIDAGAAEPPERPAEPASIEPEAEAESFFPYLLVSGGRVFHRDGCPSVARLRRGTVTRLEWSDVQGRGLEPCLICAPGPPA